MKGITSFLSTPLKLYKKIILPERENVTVMILDLGTKYNGVAQLRLDSIATGAFTRCTGVRTLCWEDFPDDGMSKEIRRLYFERKMAGIIYGFPYIKPALLAGKPFQGYIINGQVLELNSYGCFKGIPVSKFNEAGSTEKAKSRLGFGSRLVSDLTDGEKMQLDMESAVVIGEDVYAYLERKNTK